MEDQLLIRTGDPDDINTIGYLAQQIWPVAYKDIISPNQLKYMLDLLYSPQALKKQMIKEKHTFLIAELDEEPVGFASYSFLTNNEYKLHKLYVLPDIQGKGLGKALLEAVIEAIAPLRPSSLILNVNRHNKARTFYEKLGFTVVKEEDIDIGNNYFMNDFVMMKKFEVV